MDDNILTQLNFQLNKFKEDRSGINKNIEQLTTEKNLTHESMIKLQEKHENLIIDISKATQAMNNLDLTIDKLQEGYNNLIESGEFLMTIIENHSKN